MNTILAHLSFHGGHGAAGVGFILVFALVVLVLAGLMRKNP